MAYTYERDSERWQVEKDLAGVTRYFWPKIDGVGNAVASATASENTVAFYRPGGTLISGPTNMTRTLVAGSGSRLTVAFPTVADLLEDCFGIIRWTPDSGTYSGPDAGEQRHRFVFDVVLQPWGYSQVSINDLEALDAYIRNRLTRQRDAVDATQTKTVEQLASERAYDAHWMIFKRIRRRVSVSSPDRAWYLRPRMIIDRSWLVDVEAALALAMTYRHDVRDDGPQSREAKALAELWFAESDKLFDQLADVKFDTTEDDVADQSVERITRTIRTRRMQSR